ncbi:MAG: CYTH and CHAD domain-containing protein [Geminicoccaceae bacterium]
MRAPSCDYEIELKLMVDPADLARLAARLGASPFAFSAPEVLPLESRYFDTPDLRLAARRVSLRVRRSGERHVQTIKTASVGGAAHTVRGEWECTVAAMAPELDRIGDPAALEALGLVLPEELAPVFTTRVERRLMLVEQKLRDGSKAIIEVAFDRGTIEADALATGPGAGKAGKKARVEQIAEVELELKAGAPEGLYLLLETLSDWATLRISTTPKAQRGYLLATGRPPAWQRAEPPALDPAIPAGTAMAAVLASGLQQLLQNQAAAQDGRDPEGVHQLRIGLRRIRSGLALFASLLPVDERTAWDERLKAVIAATGTPRELDVLVTETLAEIKAGLPDDPALAVLTATAEAARRRAYATLRTYLQSRELAGLVLDLALWTALERWRDDTTEECAAAQSTPVIELAVALLERRHKRVRRRGRHFARLGDEERHEVRLALKKLRYGVEFLSGLFPEKPAKRYAKAAARLQDRLGRLNDQADTRRLLEALAGSAGPGTDRPALERGIGLVIGWQAACVGAERRLAVDDWHDFTAQELFWQELDEDR